MICPRLGQSVLCHCLYVDTDRVAIRFIFMGQQQRLTREGIAELL
jgi:hypothetical protein